MPLQTVLLDPQAWDLLVDANKNIAVASPPYAYAQDAASAIKLFQNEYYYDTTIGVPYWQQILGHWPSVQLMKAYWVKAALTVPDVVAAEVFIDSIIDRRPSGQVQVSDVAGVVAVAGLGSIPSNTQGGPSLDFSQPGNSQFLPGLLL